ncbi:MAG: L-gulono,4-lactone dehydrogenase [Pseudonocardiales bacterium]|nr:L-gulono,4-lactone dehydrogenase [Pseudonocardiales bacterium]
MSCSGSAPIVTANMAADHTWTNWAGTYSVTPQVTSHPADAAEVAAQIRHAAENDLSVKAVGAGHSFNGIAITRGVMLHLDRLSGIVSADLETGLVTVAAGTTLNVLNSALWNMGLAMTNLGDIDSQTISGAISTGTHGTGLHVGGIATQVRGLELVSGAGEVVRCSADENPEIFSVARVGLGALGVITEVTLQCEPAFLLQAVEAPADYDAVLEGLDAVIDAHNHFEFYWFPNTKRVLTTTNDRVPLKAGAQPVGRLRGWLDDEFLSNTVFEGINRLTTWRPGLIPAANSFAARALTSRKYSDRSYSVFSSPRRVRFEEMEYAVPRAALPYVIHEIEQWLQRNEERVGFPVEVRFAAADDIALSTAYGRQTCYIAVHEYHRRRNQKYFLAFERIARSVEGRPHWGKLHYRSAIDLAPLYPQFNNFLEVRAQLDPDRRFNNDYLRRVLGT